MFPHEIKPDLGQAGDMSTRPRQGIDELDPDGIGHEHEDSRNRSSGALRSESRRRRHGNENVYFEPNQLGREKIESLVLFRRKAIFQRDGLTID